LTTWASTESTVDSDSASDETDAERSESFRALESSPDAPRLLVFNAAGRTCACELNAVREIIPHRKATRLPGAPAYVSGLINLRGSIVTVLDVARRLGGARVDGDHASIVLAESGGKVVGLAVDELRDVQRVARTGIEPPSADAAYDGLVVGVLQTAGEIAILLDVGHLIAEALS
jgi:purine-binding chemotaxis protein CheW